MLAERMGRVSASPTMKVLVEADKLRQQGIDVVEFGAGEPDFPTPAHVKAAAGPWKYPRWIDVVDALPKTATGKIQRYKLRSGDAA